MFVRGAAAVSYVTAEHSTPAQLLVPVSYMKCLARLMHIASAVTAQKHFNEEFNVHMITQNLTLTHLNPTATGWTHIYSIYKPGAIKALISDDKCSHTATLRTPIAHQLRPQAACSEARSLRDLQFAPNNKCHQLKRYALKR